MSSSIYAAVTQVLDAWIEEIVQCSIQLRSRLSARLNIRFCSVKSGLQHACMQQGGLNVEHMLCDLLIGSCFVASICVLRVSPD